MNEPHHPFWRTILTEDNQDSVWCIVRIVALILFAVSVMLALWQSLALRQAVDLPAFIQAEAVLLGALGVAIFLNGRSEPK